MSEKRSFWDVENPFDFTHEEVGGSHFIHDGRDWLWARLRTGIVSSCPCCNQTVKCYARSINATMVKVLRMLAREGAMSPSAIGQVKFSGGGDYAKLAHWGLVQHVQGAWRITDLGRKFLAKQATVARYVYVYNATVLGMSVEQVDVNGCGRKKFDAEEIVDAETGAERELA